MHPPQNRPETQPSAPPVRRLKRPHHPLRESHSVQFYRNKPPPNAALATVNAGQNRLETNACPLLHPEGWLQREAASPAPDHLQKLDQVGDEKKKIPALIRSQFQGIRVATRPNAGKAAVAADQAAAVAAVVTSDHETDGLVTAHTGVGELVGHPGLGPVDGAQHLNDEVLVLLRLRVTEKQNRSIQISRAHTVICVCVCVRMHVCVCARVCVCVCV